MLRVTGLSMPLSYSERDLRKKICAELRIAPAALLRVRLHRRSVDARRKDNVHFEVAADVWVADEGAVRRSPRVTAVAPAAPLVLPACETPPAVPPVVIGSGPAGLLSALMLAEAGAFSDGKLNSGIGDPRARTVLERFVAAGAPEDILWQAKPHIGTDRLRDVVRTLRQQIVRMGGEVRFFSPVTDIAVRDGRLTALTVCGPDGEYQLPCTAAVLAVGHSARDTLTMLRARGVPMVQKPFAVGVRIEHPRAMIDRAQYGAAAVHPALGAADYKLHCRPNGGRGVYTFCMCPGGEVIAAASEEGGVVVNGMSEHARAAENSNSALLVGIDPGDLGSPDPLAGFAFQRRLEQAAFAAGGGGYRAPVQLVGDLLAGRETTALGDVSPSYRPGVTPADLRAVLPTYVIEQIRAALPVFARQIRGFDRPDAVLTGVESRSSSPVRLPRDGSGQSAVAGLFPCGEGAGYAGGILSAAVDGIRIAECVRAALR